MLEISNFQNENINNWKKSKKFFLRKQKINKHFFDTVRLVSNPKVYLSNPGIDAGCSVLYFQDIFLLLEIQNINKDTHIEKTRDLTFQL